MASFVSRVCCGIEYTTVTARIEHLLSEECLSVRALFSRLSARKFAHCVRKISGTAATPGLFLGSNVAKGQDIIHQILLQYGTKNILMMSLAEVGERGFVDKKYRVLFSNPRRPMELHKLLVGNFATVEEATGAFLTTPVVLFPIFSAGLTFNHVSLGILLNRSTRILCAIDSDYLEGYSRPESRKFVDNMLSSMADACPAHYKAILELRKLPVTHLCTQSHQPQNTLIEGSCGFFTIAAMYRLVSELAKPHPPSFSEAVASVLDMFNRTKAQQVSKVADEEVKMNHFQAFLRKSLHDPFFDRGTHQQAKIRAAEEDDEQAQPKRKKFKK